MLERVNKKTWMWISLTSVATALIVLFCAWVQYRENKGYETYLSNLIANKVAVMSSSMLWNDEKLDSMINNQEVTKAEAVQMISNYDSILEMSQDLCQIQSSIELNKNSGKLNNDTALIAQYFSTYIRTKVIGQENFPELAEDGSKIIKLSQEQVDKLGIMKRISSGWKKIILKNVNGLSLDGGEENYWDKYSSRKAIHNSYWKNINYSLSGYVSDSDILILKNELADAED